MKIVFIEPRPPEEHVYSNVKLPRLGALILGSILREKGHEVKVYVEEIREPEFKELATADVVGISTITSTAPRGFMWADKVRKAGVPVIIGGPHPSFLAEEALMHGDYVVRGESELVINDLIHCIANNQLPYHLPGVSFKDGDQVINNPRGPFVQNLDSLPIPDYSLIPGWEKHGRVVSIETSRGCPYDCSFCAVVKMFGRKYRFNSIDRVLEEVRQYTGKTGHIFFCDDNFTAKPARTKELLTRMLEEGLLTGWSAQVRVEAAKDPELLELMARTRCFMVYVGLESVNPRSLELYRKHQTLDDIKQCVRTFHHYGIHVHGMFVIGSDVDDVKTIHETTKFARELKIDSVQLLILTPIPGTEVYDQLENEGRIFDHNWANYDGHNVVFEPKLMSSYELQLETFRAMDKFYTYSSLARYFLKLDYSYMAIRLYALRMASKGLRVKKKYAEYLKQGIVQRLSSVRELPGALVKRITKVAIPSGLVEHNYQRFFSNFLHQLGLEVVTDAEKGKDLPDWTTGQAGHIVDFLKRQLQVIQKKADVVVLPRLRGIRGQLTAVKSEGETLAQEIKKLVAEGRGRYISIEINPEALYKSCVEIGMALNKSLSSIRKAYERACQLVPING